MIPLFDLVRGRTIVTFNLRAALVAVLVSILFPSVAQARLQCVPFARQVSGIEIRGNAETWWAQASGRYERNQTPREGAVLAMPGIRKMPMGHVAMVSKVISDREILLTHANWSRPGMIERNVRAVDVSENGDWSLVRVWHAGSGDLGVTRYPAHGFIHPNRPAERLESPLQIARFTLGDDIRNLAANGG
jgi:surface antigen